MLESCDREEIIALLKQEVVPAIGCTEPIAVAFAVARACDILGGEPLQIEVSLSANILKNAMGVGIPATGMTGLPIAIALGATVGRWELGLEVLREVTPEAVSHAKELIDENRIEIVLKENIEEKLYIAAVVRRDGNTARVVVANGHTHIVYEAHNEEVLLNANPMKQRVKSNAASTPLSMELIYNFATTTPVEDIAFILEAKRLNMAAAEQSLANDYGLNVGRMVVRQGSGTEMFGSNPFIRILSYTAAACDARMAGAMIPVMSNSGSGNQGIAATLPVVVYAEEHQSSREQLIRALIISHLIAIYIKQHLGLLSALCGCVVAATGSSCGITYLMGGSYLQLTYAVKNMIANLTGMICDGAKPSCALKISSGVSTAVLSAVMAMENRYVSSLEGIIDEDVDQCIKNLSIIGRDSMGETDRLVLQIMTDKC